MVTETFNEMDTHLKNENICVDMHMQDQLIIFMALCEGKSEILCGPLELHTESAIQYMQDLTGATFTTTCNDDGTVLIECEGIGF